MTMNITMRQSRLGEADQLLTAGVTYSVSAAFGAEMVGAGYALDTAGVLTPPQRANSANAIEFAQGGYNCALFFDSMTDWNFVVNTPSSTTYANGVVTITFGSAHLMPLGGAFNFWNPTFASLLVRRTLTVASVVSSTVITANLPPGDYSDLPSTLTGSTFVIPAGNYASKSWLNWINSLSGQRFRIVSNTAQSGVRSDSCLAQLPTAMAAWEAAGATMVVGQVVGVNDLTFDSATQRNDSAETRDNIQQILDTIRQAGYRMLLSTITPVATGEARAQLRIMSQIQWLNRFLQKYAMKYADRVTLIDPAALVTNPTDATGLATSTYLNATDKIHYSNWGAYKVAKAELAKVVAAYPVQRSSLPMTVIDAQTGSALTTPTGVAASNVITITSTAAYMEIGQEFFLRGATGSYTALNGRQVATSQPFSNIFTFTSETAVPDGSVTGTLFISPSRQLLDDPLMQTTGGSLTTITGTGTDVPGQWSARVIGGTCTGAASIVNDSEGFGKASRISVSTVAAVDGRVGWAFKNSTGTLETKMIPGRTYQFEGKLVITSTDWSATPISEIQFELNIGANSTETWRMSALNQYENVAPLIASGTSTETLHLKTPPLTVPLGSVLNSAQATIALRWQAAQASGTLTMDLSRVAFRDVTEDGLELVS